MSVIPARLNFHGSNGNHVIGFSVGLAMIPAKNEVLRLEPNSFRKMRDFNDASVQSQAWRVTSVSQEIDLIGELDPSEPPTAFPPATVVVNLEPCESPAK